MLKKMECAAQAVKSVAAQPSWQVGASPFASHGSGCRRRCEGAEKLFRRSTVDSDVVSMKAGKERGELWP